MRLVVVLSCFVALACATSPVSTAEEPVDPAAELQAQLDAEHAARVKAEAELRRMTRLAYLRRQHLRRYRRVLLQHEQVTTSIRLASIVYGQSYSLLLRKALCETGGSLWPRSHNPSGASGLFQFLPSTWRSTPFGGFSIWSPWANALAAGWMHAHGRGGEWECR